MTENPQNPPAPPEEGGDESGQESKPGPVNAPDSTGESTGFAVYDVTLKRFVGSVQSTRAKAEKGVGKVKGHKYETRSV